MKFTTKFLNQLYLTIFLFACLILFGCVSTSVTRIGNYNYAPLQEDEEVIVYTKETLAGIKHETIGIINYERAGKYTILTLEDAMPELKKMARSIGANGLIIDESYPVKSGIISTGIHVKALAIKVE